MYVKVRTVDGKQEVSLDVSKLTRIEELKFMINQKWSIKEEKQKLFYRGKLLEEDYKLFDYNVNMNDVIQVMVTKEENDANNGQNEETHEDEKIEEAQMEGASSDLGNSLYYRVGDKIDCQDREYGAWFEASIDRICRNQEGVVYKLKWEFSEDEQSFDASDRCIRPRAYRTLSFDELKPGNKVMINHNIDEPEKNGFWYDFTIIKMKKTMTIEELVGTLHIGHEETVNDCKINPRGEIYAIEEAQLIENRNEEVEKRMFEGMPKRRRAVVCINCNDEQSENCRECGCKVCGGKYDSHVLLLCDECNYAYHLQCLKPPLTALPTDDYWYCPTCKRNENDIVKTGGKKQTKKKIKEPGKNNVRNWGNGMACAGREEECTIVPRDHRGAVPGVEVGTSWLFRLGVSQAGIHRPHVAGIHGRGGDCAYSIVLSGGYEDDIDNGDEFMYTGSGGRDLSGNKRTAGQSCDQKLTRMNRALALNCDAELNTKIGATAKNWKNGIPVRVVRKYNPHASKYAPKIGYRYDGLYKVVKYFPQKGKSGFYVWRYCLRRDDSTPAPWTKEGQERIAALGLELICPEGYEVNAEKERKSRQSSDSTEEDEHSTPPKKKLKDIYRLDKKLLRFIKHDTVNAKLWEDCKNMLSDGQSAFLKRVTDRFLCVCCQELVYKPVTTPCGHNICQNCLKRGFRVGVYTCPTCRRELDKNQKDLVNEALSSALLHLFPGYEKTR